jgi:hypothetical protein
VIDIDEVATPLARTGDVPEIVDVTAETAPAVKVTEPSDFATGVTIASVFTSAFVELNVQVEIPEAFVAEQVP